MDDITQAPKVAATHSKNALSKIPKPIAVAAAIGVVGLVYYKKKHNTAVTASSAPGNTTPVADQGSTGQSFSGPGDMSGSIASPYSGYGNVGNYNTGLPASIGSQDNGTLSSGSSDTTHQSGLGDVTALIGTLFPGGLPLGSGPVQNPFQGQGMSPVSSAPSYSSAPQAPAPVGTLTAPVQGPAQSPVYYAPPTVSHTPAAVGTVTTRGQITGITHSGGKTCHVYAGGKKECF